MNFVKLFPTPVLGVLSPGGALQIVWGWLLPVLVPVAVVAGVVYWLNCRPLWRQEGARFLLDLVESALRQGQSVEHHIISLARSGDPAPGERFHLLASHLEEGHTLIPALKKVPELLPPQVLAMLQVGGELGDFRRVLPACRHLLSDGTSQSRALINYQVAFGLALNPLMLLVLPLISCAVLPVFNQVAGENGIKPGGVLATPSALFPVLFLVQMALVLACFVGAVLLLGGARFVSFLEDSAFPLRDWSDCFFLRVPWRRKRLQRDFSAMLGLLLDAGVPEERALSLAAFSTANRAFMRRAEKAAARLRLGAKLAEALRLLDDTGEFGWRLANGAHGARGFFFALQGWQASLDAKAFQQEQAAAHIISTSLVLLNAVTVALVASAIFQFITRISFTPFRS